MIQSKKKIKNAYIDFSNDVLENSKLTILYRDPVNKSWGEIIYVYDTLKYIENEYLDFKDYKIDTRKISVGNVLHVRHERVICWDSSFLFNGFYIIISKSDTEIIIEKHETLAKAVREQRKKSESYGFLPIPNQSKWKKNEKHI